MKNKEKALEEIRANIARYGQHIYAVAGGQSPRFAYSIGLSQEAGVELIMAGASFYSTNEVGDIMDGIAEEIRKNKDWRQTKFEVGLGAFTLGKVHDSWSSRFILGALDYYKVSGIETLQILPDREHWTIDIPNLKKKWSATSEPVWQWLENPWSYPVPKRSMAVTNLDALKGKPVTEATRWEENEWELFAGAGPDVEKADIRMVPLGTLIGADRSVEAVAGLEVGEGLWRDSTDLEWHPWLKEK